MDRIAYMCKMCNAEFVLIIFSFGLDLVFTITSFNPPRASLI